MQTALQSPVTDVRSSIINDSTFAPAADRSLTDIATDAGDAAGAFYSHPCPDRAGLPTESALARRDNAEAFSIQQSTEPRDGEPLSLSSTHPLRPQSSSLTASALIEGQRRLTAVQLARDLRAQNASWESIELTLGIPAATLIRWDQNAEANRAARLSNPQSTIRNPQFISADCAPQNHKAGRPAKYRLTADEVAFIRATGLAQTNRNATSASMPEAFRRGIAAGALRPEIAQEFHERELRGLPLLTDAMREQVRLSQADVRAHRSPRSAWLDLVQSPGSLMITRDEETGEERFFQPGEAYTIDDGSINLGCCVALERPGDKCWEKFGVIVGRFQFIPVADHRTRAILGFSYTARPRDSYRAEDLTATMQTVFAEHGIPRIMFLEHGVSNANLVNQTLERLGVQARHVHSPHQKIIEKLFDLLWTKLAALPGQVGRFRGEMEKENLLLMACKRGEKDPRDHFPQLPQVLAGMRQAIAELNAQWMESQQYGRWQPGEWFARAAHKTTRKLAPQDAWMFSPVITRPLIVRGFCVGTSVSLMPGLSLKFHFGAEFFGHYIGHQVILHFNPFAPECEAMVVHAATGRLLGPAEQINRHARFSRRAFGYGLDPDIGHIAARKHAQAMHRTVVAIKTGSPAAAQLTKPVIGQAVAETRDGLGNGQIAQIGGNVPAATPQPTRRADARRTPEKNEAVAQSSRRQADIIRQLQARQDEE